MTGPTRRSVLRGSLGLAAAGMLARPAIANAAATTATVWWTQGFAREEDIAFQTMTANYEKASGNKIELSLIPFAPMREKLISALTSGNVPDVSAANYAEFVATYAWNDKLVDVSDVVDTQKSEYSDTALSAGSCYNSIARHRSFYGVPVYGAVLPNHIWRPLVEKAGYRIEDAPKTWDAYYDFFKPMQKRLRAQGLRNVYSIGFQVTTNGIDPNNLFNYFLIAYGGQNLVTKNGRLHLDDPQVRAAAIRALAYLTTAYKEGYVPPGAINWNDADDNNAFHAKQIVMDLDGTISTEVAMFADKQAYYHDVVTMGLPLSNDGQPVPSQVTVTNALIPKGAKNVAVAKEFAGYFIQPQIVGNYLKTGLGRFLPVMPSIARTDPFWLDPKDPHRPSYTRQGLLGPTLPNFWSYNPAYAEVQTMHIWSAAMADIIRNDTPPPRAAETAFRQVRAVFAKYPIAES